MQVKEFCFVVFKMVLVVFVQRISGQTYPPVVLIHGYGNDSSSMNLVEKWIQGSLPGIYVKNLEIGDGWFDSIFMSLDEQVNLVCSQLSADKNLTNTKINIIGYDQGALIARAYIQRCNNPPVYNFISWSGPHGG